jgi:hypothetical protein
LTCTDKHAAKSLAVDGKLALQQVEKQGYYPPRPRRVRVGGGLRLQLKRFVQNDVHVGAQQVLLMYVASLQFFEHLPE